MKEASRTAEFGGKNVPGIWEKGSALQQTLFLSVSFSRFSDFSL